MTASRKPLFPNRHVLIGLLTLTSFALPAQEVKLVVQITVDGLRGDLLNRYESNLSDGGFKRLMNRGLVYTQAYYEHANTETIVGHSTLATGAQPRDHGMVANLWFDPVTGQPQYNVEDPDFPLLPTREEKENSAQVDPSQAAATSDGRSPATLLSTTFADELSLHTAGKAKIFAVSGKDRGAVPMAGQAGKAFWFNVQSGHFCSSRYYYETYPEWVENWNAQQPAHAYAGKSWELLLDPEVYLLKDRDDRPYETDLGGFGRTFPHPYGNPGEKLFTTLLMISPAGDALTASFTTSLLTAEQLGRDSVTDYLSVSFSGVDATNHFFGPSSLENEDQVLQLDRVLEEFFDFLDGEIGLEHVLIVLSADHGMAEMPEEMEERGMQVSRETTDTLKEALNTFAHDRYGKEELVSQVFRPYVYLNGEAIQSAGLDRAEVAQALATHLQSRTEIAHALPFPPAPGITENPVIKQLINNYHPERSGDIHFVQHPYWFTYEKGHIAVMHGTPWNYDTYVPILLTGPGIPIGTITQQVQPAQIVATLSTLLGIKPPSHAHREPLPFK